MSDHTHTAQGDGDHGETFDERRVQDDPCVVCGHVVVGGHTNPPCQDVQVCRYRDGSVAGNKWRGVRAQPDSERGIE